MELQQQVNRNAQNVVYILQWLGNKTYQGIWMRQWINCFLEGGKGFSFARKGISRGNKGVPKWSLGTRDQEGRGG
jgi:hypothetical protein